MKKDFYNLNHEKIYTLDFECGSHQNITIKVGKSFYLVDLDKNSGGTYIEFYKRVSKDRASFSKYDDKAGKVETYILNNAILDRDFFENLKIIRACQNFLSKYDDILKRW